MSLLGRKLFKPLNVVLPTLDSAIDLEASKLSEYFETFDETNLVIKGDPARFCIQQLTEQQKDAIEGVSNIRIRAKLIIRFSLLGITNYQTTDEQGSLFTPSIDRVNGPHGQWITEEGFSKLGFTIEIIVALSSIILAFSEARAVPLA